MAISIANPIKRIPRWIFLFALCIAAFAAAWMLVAPKSSANGDGEKTSPRKIGHSYHIRNDSSEEARNLIARKRAAVGSRQGENVAAAGEKMEKARASFKARNPSAEVVVSDKTGAPEIVGTLSAKQKLTGRSPGGRAEAVRGFMSANAALYGLTTGEVAELKKTADYENPNGNMAWVEFEQQIDGIPVFQGTLRAGMTKRGELIRTTGLLVPGIDRASAKPLQGQLSRTVPPLSGPKAFRLLVYRPPARFPQVPNRSA